MYTFHSPLARERWNRETLLWEVNRDLGYPIIVLQECGAYALAPPAPLDKRYYVSSAVEQVVRLGKASKVEVRNSPIEGKGVFATERLAKGEVVGTYNGKVFTYEHNEEIGNLDENFLFCLNDGANGKLQH